ncbi:hypothetical protein FCR2A7T_03130 [Flavobacterium cauense R2A-7]|uniref:Lipoprotein n=1 Tax=Flavobacterium cauense R2A-7 TaxID=1341154 RepID=V6SBS3_9FLAO|nr:hypothetical protein [Flavobacterium cauense]ESU21855.1 hypothetical protein FCR2A7T_03130 [Flavobacterium cauense R2A-7]TWI13001.1 hypothetical protein IP98_01483 [Flavobacterium cauense R2A-7]
MYIKTFLPLLLLSTVFFSCTDQDDTAVVAPHEPQLIVKFKFDPTQVRLNNLGQPSSVPSGNAAQSPVFNSISSHYLEFAPTANTALGAGTVLYHAPETTAGGTNAIDFSKAKIVGEGEVFLSIPLRNIAAGSYEWVRCSLSYQNYKINVLSAGTEYVGTLASFVGFNNYITTHTVGSYTFPVNGNRSQGYWAFGLSGYNYSTSGQTPAGATTVPNPLAATSPIPAGSCVVTGQFSSNLVITGTETQDVVVTLSLSVNNSFEWHEVNADGKYEPAAGENVVDMGLRGLIPSFQ